MKTVIKLRNKHIMWYNRPASDILISLCEWNNPNPLIWLLLKVEYIIEGVDLLYPPTYNCFIYALKGAY